MKPIIPTIILAGLFTLAACNNSAIKEKEAALQAQQRTIDSMNAELAKKRVIDSMSEVANTQYILTPPASAPVPPAVTSTSRRSTRSYGSHAGRTTHSTSSTQSQTVATQEAPRKKGWSAKAKGAVIGTATGAAAGAIINKRNRAAGAVIGGILGAGAGTGVGAVIDKKKGR